MTFVDVISMIRGAELGNVVSAIPEGKILELGAGTGQQALEMTRRGFDVVAVDLNSSHYKKDRVFPIIDYDGVTLPFEDGTFDAVFSSNVLEHVTDIAGVNREIRRVLKPSGKCIHILPTPTWRAWTWAAAAPAAVKHLLAGRLRRSAAAASYFVFFRPHGEFPTAIHELRTFRPEWWRNVFERDGYRVLQDRPVGLFYTGEALLGTRLDAAARARLAERLGSSTHLFVIAPV